jgi:glycosyltransferase involved in cell wall biosynthesis
MKAARALELGDVWIVIPAYNEAAMIGSVVESLRSLRYPNLCVVNDGSSDETSDLACRAGAYVLNHITNLGQGAALETGIQFALQRGAQYVCTFDADGQHSPHSIGDLLMALKASGADVAIGSRFLGSGSAIPLHRRLLLKAAVWFTRLHARVYVTDTHNGLRAFTRQAAQKIHIEQPGMAHASEILHKLGTSGMQFVEVPVKVAYTAYSRRKGQATLDSIKILLDLLYGSIALRH